MCVHMYTHNIISPTCNLSTWRMSQEDLDFDFKANLCCTVRPLSLKKKRLLLYWYAISYCDSLVNDFEPIRRAHFFIERDYNCNKPKNKEIWKAMQCGHELYLPLCNIWLIKVNLNCFVHCKLFLLSYFPYLWFFINFWFSYFLFHMPLSYVYCWN
jgi:hypothetical protein